MTSDKVLDWEGDPRVEGRTVSEMIKRPIDKICYLIGFAAGGGEGGPGGVGVGGKASQILGGILGVSDH